MASAAAGANPFEVVNNPGQYGVNTTPQPVPVTHAPGISQTPNASGTSRPATPSPAATQAQAPAPVTADPRDAAYYEQVARLNHALQGALASYGATAANNQAAYNLTSGQLRQQLPITLQNERNRANAQGLLESGALAQRSGLDETAYANRVGAALARFNNANSVALNRRNAAQGSYNEGVYNAMYGPKGAIERAASNDVSVGPTTPGLAKKTLAQQYPLSGGDVVSRAAANLAAARKAAAKKATRK